MTVRNFVRTAKASLSQMYSEREAGAIVTRLCEEVLALKSYEWMLDPSLEVPETHAGQLSSALGRLRCGEPLQYVLGYADFCGFRFNVNPSVLIPRPETEELCYIILDRLSGLDCPTFMPGRIVPASAADCPAADHGRRLRILDLCTGSGCIAWTLALSLPGAEVTGVDISEEALQTARTQPLAGEAARLGATVPRFVRYDVLAGPGNFPPAPSSACGVASDRADFDVIVSNPPYVRESERESMPSNVKDFEPGLALFVPDSDPMLFYRAIAQFAITRIIPGGFGFVEANEALEGPVRVIFASAGFSEIEPIRDFRTKFRFFSFRK